MLLNGQGINMVTRNASKNQKSCGIISWGFSKRIFDRRFGLTKRSAGSVLRHIADAGRNLFEARKRRHLYLAVWTFFQQMSCPFWFLRYCSLDDYACRSKLEEFILYFTIVHTSLKLLFHHACITYSVDSIKRTVLLKVLLLKKNFKKSLLKILFTISKQYF